MKVYMYIMHNSLTSIVLSHNFKHINVPCDVRRHYYRSYYHHNLPVAATDVITGAATLNRYLTVWGVQKDLNVRVVYVIGCTCCYC